jgi:putative aldouronate transport system substrate-binding protein
MKLQDADLTVKSRAHSYASVDYTLVEEADKICNTDMKVGKNVNVGTIEAEEGQGTALSSKRDIIYDNAVVASVDDFDKVWDDGIADYLSSGGQAIIDERTEKWEATFGDTDMLPE